MTKNDCVKSNSTGYCKTDTNRRKVSRSQLAYITTEMLNKARYSRPRPKPTARGRGRGRGHMQKKKSSQLYMSAVFIRE